MSDLSDSEEAARGGREVLWKIVTQVVNEWIFSYDGVGDDPVGWFGLSPLNLGMTGGGRGMGIAKIANIEESEAGLGQSRLEANA